MKYAKPPPAKASRALIECFDGFIEALSIETREALLLMEFRAVRGQLDDDTPITIPALPLIRLIRAHEEVVRDRKKQDQKTRDRIAKGSQQLIE